MIDLAREAIWDIDSLYADYYRVAWRFVPNWLGTSLLVMFGFLLPLPIVEKLLLSVALIVFCSGFACLLRRGREDAPVVLLAVPAFGWGFWLHMGFYNYSLGLALLPWSWLFMAQLLERSAGDSRTTKRAAAALCICSIAAFFAHPIAAIAVLTAAASMWLGHSRLSLRHGLPLALRLGLPLLPLTVLWATFAWMHPTGEHSRWGMQRLLGTSLNLGGLSTYGELQGQFALVLASVLLCLVFSQMWRIYADRDSRSWVVLSALLLLMVLVIPNGDGEFGYISLRLSVLPWLALLPVAAKARLQAPWTRVMIAVALLSASGGILLAPLPSQIALSSRLEQWSVLGRTMDYGATAMTLDFRRFGASPQSTGPDVFMHGVGRIALDRNLIDVLEYQSRTNHFHLTLRPHVDFPVPVQVVLTPERLNPARWADRVRYAIISDLDRAPAAWLASFTTHYRLALEHAGLHLFESKNARNER